MWWRWQWWRWKQWDDDDNGDKENEDDDDYNGDKENEDDDNDICDKENDDDGDKENKDDDNFATGNSGVRRTYGGRQWKQAAVLHKFWFFCKNFDLQKLVICVS